MKVSDVWGGRRVEMEVREEGGRASRHAVGLLDGTYNASLRGLTAGSYEVVVGITAELQGPFVDSVVVPLMVLPMGT